MPPGRPGGLPDAEAFFGLALLVATGGSEVCGADTDPAAGGAVDFAVDNVLATDFAAPFPNFDEAALSAAALCPDICLVAAVLAFDFVFPVVLLSLMAIVDRKEYCGTVTR